jgi:hypothetical protein
MSGSGPQSKLVAGAKEIYLRWEETRNYWKDAQCDDFDRRYMRELLGRVDQAAIVMEKLDELLTKIRKDCE